MDPAGTQKWGGGDAGTQNWGECVSDAADLSPTTTISSARTTTLLGLCHAPEAAQNGHKRKRVGEQEEEKIEEEAKGKKEKL